MTQDADEARSSFAFLDPDTIHAPSGAYRHSCVVPRDARLLFVSGQIGVRPDGGYGESLAEQADQAFANLVSVLKAHGAGAEAIIKLSTFLVVGQSTSEVASARRRHLGDHRPTATFVFVPQLFLPDWLVEIEAVAALP